VSSAAEIRGQDITRALHVHRLGDRYRRVALHCAHFTAAATLRVGALVPALVLLPAIALQCLIEHSRSGSIMETARVNVKVAGRSHRLDAEGA